MHDMKHEAKNLVGHFWKNQILYYYILYMVYILQRSFLVFFSTKKN